MRREDRKLLETLHHIEMPILTDDRRDRLDELIWQEAGKMIWIPSKSIVVRIWEQAAYICPRTWFSQLLLLLMGMLLLLTDMKETAIQMVSLIVPFLGLVGIPELTKSFTYGMWELEESCYYNLRQVLLLKMILFGIADTVLLLTLVITAGSQGSGTMEALYYLMIPFHVSTACYLGLFRILKRRCDGFVLAAAACLMVIVGYLFQRYELFHFNGMQSLMEQGKLWLVLGISVAAMLGMSVSILRNVEKEDGMIWSLE